MKLGIIVVYLFKEQSERLLDLHLAQIEKCTQIPYTIYGSVNRLSTRFKQRLVHHPKVQIYECPATNLRGGDEHAYYLDHLVRMAIEDGSSHIVTLHLDSFPVRSGWAKELAEKLSGTCVLVTIERINTACLLFHRDFYIQYRPNFRPSKAERADPKFQQYLKEYNPIDHTGIGYGFKAHLKRNLCYYLPLTAGDNSYSSGVIYDDMIFHLIGGIRKGELQLKRTSFFLRPGYIRFVENLISVWRSILPIALRKKLPTQFRELSDFISRPLNFSRISQAKRGLFEDPESYLALLRKNK